MARVFAQDVLKVCEEQGIDSKYEMILLAAYRAKKVRKLPLNERVLPAEEYKEPSTGVIAMREIESGQIDLQALKEECIKSKCKVTESDPEQDEVEEN
jgi:DNA-directed RNA polymerase omega subunit